MLFQIIQWQALSEDDRRTTLSRPAQVAEEDRRAEVAKILLSVRQRGDRALRDLTARYDGIEIADLRVQDAEFATAESQLSMTAIDAIDTAIENVRIFHAAQQPIEIDLETTPGVRCQRISQALDAVGMYVPAGSAPLPSTAIMLCVPASLAAATNEYCARRPAATARRIRRCSWPLSEAASIPSSKWAALRRLRPWRTAPKRCRESIRFLVQATHG